MDSNEEVYAAIVSGQHENIMNIQDSELPVPVIDATGLDADEIIEGLNNIIGYKN